jgi:hypothetical protein
MFSKTRGALLALAAVATIGVGSLVASTDSAQARGFHAGSGFKGGSVGRIHVGGGRHIGTTRHIGHRPIFGRGPSFGHRPIHIRRHITIRPSWCWRHPWRCRPIVRWPRPIIVGAPVIAATTYAVAPAVATARPCTCLTKEYTPDNLVVFKDNCTKEVASAPVGNTQVQLPVQAPTQQQ